MGLLDDIIDGLLNSDSDSSNDGIKIDEDGTIGISGGTIYEWYQHSDSPARCGLIKAIQNLISSSNIQSAESVYYIYTEHAHLFDKGTTDAVNAVANFLLGDAYLQSAEDFEIAKKYIETAYSLYESDYPYAWRCFYDMYFIYKREGNIPEARKCLLLASQYVKKDDVLRIDSKEVNADKFLLNEFNDIDNEYTRSFLDIPYKNRKALLIVDRFTNLFQDHFETLHIDSDLSQLSFPFGHPKTNEIYLAHPFTTNRYMPIESYQLELIEEMVREFSEIAQEMGAIEIDIDCLNSNLNESTKASSNIISGGVAKDSNSIAGSKHTEDGKRLFEKISRSISLHQTFQPYKPPVLLDNLLWYNGKSLENLQQLYRQRMNGLLTHTEKVETEKSQIVDNREMKEIKGELQSLFADMNVAFDKTEESKFEQQENAVLAISVKFAPLSQLTGNATTMPNYSANEQKK